MRHKRIQGSIWLPVVMALCFGLLADMAYGNTGAKNQPPVSANDLLQFKAGSHIMGFKPGKVYLVNTSGFLSVEFLGAHDTPPIVTTADNNQTTNEPALTQLTQVSGNTLANLQRVEYQSLWDRITLRYEAVQEGIAESTYIIQPGGNVADIRLKYNADTELQKDGSLKINLSTRQGYITESRPVAWQMLDGRKKEVQVAYEIQDGAIGFKTGEYNKDHELIIDPTYQWHTYYGSSDYDYGESIAVDGNGNVYVTGFSAAGWVVNTGTPAVPIWHDPKHAHSGGVDIAVLKLDSSGTYQWHTFYGSEATDLGKGIAVDGNGNVYVTGCSDASWVVNNGMITYLPKHAHSGGDDIAVLKLDSSGTYQWHTFYGSANNDVGLGIAVDGNGNSYVTGYSGADWAVTIGIVVHPPKHAHSGEYDILVLKLDSSGAYQWHTFYGAATHSDYGISIAVDDNGNVHVTGLSLRNWVAGDDMIVHPPKHAHSGGEDIVALKLDSSGAYQWHTFYGSSNNDEGFGIAIDGNGNSYVTGYSDATWGTPANSFSGGTDIVVFGLDSSGTLMWNTFHGSAGTDEGRGIVVDRSGNIHITGSSSATWGNPLNSHGGEEDIVTCKLSGSGNLLWHTFHGSASNEKGCGIAVDGNANIYVAGTGWATWGSPLHASAGMTDIIVMKLVQPPMFIPAVMLLLSE